MCTRTVREHHRLLAVIGRVSIQQAVHTAGSGLPTELRPFIVLTKEDLLIDSLLGLIRIGETYANRRLRSPMLDSFKTYPFDECGSRIQRFRVHGCQHFEVLRFRGLEGCGDAMYHHRVYRVLEHEVRG